MPNDTPDTATAEPAPPPSAGPAAPKQPNVLGLIGLILAIVGFVLAVIPFVAAFAWLLTLPALVLGIVGLTRKGQKKLTSILALAISTVAWIIAVVVASTSFFVAAVEGAPDDGGAKGAGAMAEAGEAVPISIGVAFPVDMGDGDVARINIHAATYSTESLSDGGLAVEPENGGFLTLHVIWQTESGQTEADPHYIKVLDASGGEGDLHSIADGMFGSGDVPEGDRIRGNLVFDVGPGPYTVIVTDPLLHEAARVEIVLL